LPELHCDVPFKVFIDTGCTVTIAARDTVIQNGWKIEPWTADIALLNGTLLRASERAWITVTFSGYKVTLFAYVFERSSLLGGLYGIVLGTDFVRAVGGVCIDELLNVSFPLLGQQQTTPKGGKPRIGWTCAFAERKTGEI
jgi:hypothetical protein